jgi:lipoyl(octanoyl) transferase
VAGKNEGGDSGCVIPEGHNAAPLFTRLWVFEDQEPRNAALQMALDRVLLETTALPVLRFYRWSEPCVTVGYFESLEQAAADHPGLPVVRRWTGGGSVLHTEDSPYSLIVPRAEPFVSVRPAESYRLIHDALARALRAALPGVTTAQETAPKRSGACFENPVADDLLLEGCKIAGAGQRRTRAGLLHQGSIQIGGKAFTQAWPFAALLATTPMPAPLPLEALEHARLILASKPGTSQIDLCDAARSA